MNDTLQKFIEGAFTFAATLFDKFTPAWMKGYRSVLGFIGMGVVAFLQAKGIVTDTVVLTCLYGGFGTWTAAALNAKARPEDATPALPPSK